MYGRRFLLNLHLEAKAASPSKKKNAVGAVRLLLAWGQVVSLSAPKAKICQFQSKQKARNVLGQLDSIRLCR